jgi:hypothetical protein
MADKIVNSCIFFIYSARYGQWHKVGIEYIFFISRNVSHNVTIFMKYSKIREVYEWLFLLSNFCFKKLFKRLSVCFVGSVKYKKLSTIDCFYYGWRDVFRNANSL